MTQKDDLCHSGHPIRVIFRCLDRSAPNDAAQIHASFLGFDLYAGFGTRYVERRGAKGMTRAVRLRHLEGSRMGQGARRTGFKTPIRSADSFAW